MSMVAASSFTREAAFPEEDLFPHVARYLNPPAGMPPTAQLWEVDDDALESPRGLGAGCGVYWALRWKDREVPFRLEGAELVLFRVGVGNPLRIREELDRRLQKLWALRREQSLAMRQQLNEIRS